MEFLPPTANRMIRESARLFAERGFHGTSIDAIGAACGMTGPAIYKHFPNKKTILSTMLLDISRQLLEDGRQVAGDARSPEHALKALIEFHASFAVHEAALIRVQDRDLGSLDTADRRTVRRLQREYLELWVSVLSQAMPSLSRAVARVRAHATFGLLNSTPHSGSGSGVKGELMKMAERALEADACLAALSGD